MYVHMYIYMYLRGVCFVFSRLHFSYNYLHDFCQNKIHLDWVGHFHEFIEAMISVNKMVKP